MAKARTARQRAALRKAQLASARKRKGKPNKILKAAHARSRRVGGAIGRAVLIGGGIAAGYYGAKAFANYQSRKNNYKSKTQVRYVVKIPKQSKPKVKVRTSPTTNFDSRYNAAVAYRKSQAKEAQRKRRNARYARISAKVADRGMYNAGLPLNVGGRTFVAGRGGTYRR